MLCLKCGRGTRVPPAVRCFGMWMFWTPCLKCAPAAVNRLGILVSPKLAQKLLLITLNTLLSVEQCLAKDPEGGCQGCEDDDDGCSHLHPLRSLLWAFRRLLGPWIDERRVDDSWNDCHYEHAEE